MGMMDANALASSSGNEIMGIINSINIAEIGISFIIYFIGGYMLYASIFAAIGSAVDSQEDTQQFMAPVTIFMIFALYAGIYSMENPDGLNISDIVASILFIFNPFHHFLDTRFFTVHQDTYPVYFGG